MKNNIYIVGIGSYGNSNTYVNFKEILKLNEDDSFLRFLSVAFEVQLELLDTKVLDFSKISIDDFILESYCKGYYKFAMYLNSIKNTQKYGFISIVKRKTNINRIEQAILVIEMFARGGFKLKNEDKNSLLRSSMKFLNNVELEIQELFKESSVGKSLPDLIAVKLYEND